MTNGILALDMATRTGWARHVQGVTDSGYVDFPKGPGGDGERFYTFSKWLQSMCMTAPDNKVVGNIAYERPLGRFATSQAQAHLSLGMLGALKTFAWRHGIVTEAVPIQTIKMYATGKGNASKAAVMAAVNERWPDGDNVITDDNESDARALLAYCMEARN